MAEVYLAQDELLDRPVAVKVLFAQLAQDPSFVERFRREARSAALLNHPNIVSVYDFGEDPEGYFIVMEYVAGPALSEVIAADGSMAPSRAVGLAADVAAALAAAHGEGIIHRDIKPANVLIDAGRAKVADFGIAQVAGAADRLTMPGAVVGTATYLSPEQALGHAVDHRSDIYSLGMVLYEMLAGHAPFAGDNPVTVAYKQQHEVPPPPSAANQAVSPQLDALVARTMSLDPDARPQTADELRAALLTVADAPSVGAAAANPTVAFPVEATAMFAPPAAGAAVAAPASGGESGRGEAAGGAIAAGAGGAAAIAARRSTPDQARAAEPRPAAPPKRPTAAGASPSSASSVCLSSAPSRRWRCSATRPRIRPRPRCPPWSASPWPTPRPRSAKPASSPWSVPKTYRAPPITSSTSDPRPASRRIETPRYRFSSLPPPPPRRRPDPRPGRPPERPPRPSRQRRPPPESPPQSLS